MRHFDVFNGDADGICSLHQLRLDEPCDSTLVTGMKRDIALLESVPAQAGDVVTVLDVSLDRNRDALRSLLDRGAEVRYFDHHYAGEPVIERLGRERAADMERALATKAMHESACGAVWMLPDAAWARRVSGTFANRLALHEPYRAHAVLTPVANGGYMVSVRAARAGGTSAGEFCRGFEGSGRVLAGGVDCLEAGRVEAFIASFEAAWPAR